MDQPPQYKVTNRATGSSFFVKPGETVLAAAHRQDVHLSYSCLNGTCASCHAQLLSGEVDYPFLPPRALSREERASGLALLCQAVPRSDLTLVAREPAALRDVVTRVLAVRADRIDRVAPDVMRIMLRLPRGERLQYLAGQYLDFLLPDGKRRAFSIANAPHTSDRLELHIRHVPGGGFTDFVFSELKNGALLRIEAPLGTFFLRDRSSRPMICVAGGTGFAPIKAIVEQFIANHESRDLWIYWGARTPPDLYLHDLPRAWEANHRNIRYIPVLSEPAQADGWTGRRGLVHRAVLEDHPDLAHFDVYMSGPPQLIDAGRHEFADHRLPENHLYYDSFEFAPDVLAKMYPKDDEA